MQSIDFDQALERIVQNDPRYDREAYRFVRDALDFTQQRLAKAGERPAARSGRKGSRKEPPNHVSGSQLLAGIREFALQLFGPMVTTVFSEWGIRGTEDFGEIVFNMVDARLLNKTPEDSKSDFKGVYDFREVFERPFLPESKLQLGAAQAPTKGS
jgi:uncharacterized repeat protein (TIGR04138 family)